MGKGKMDDAAAERIRKARGDKDDFARRAAIAAKANKEVQVTNNEQNGNSSAKQRGSESGNKK